MGRKTLIAVAATLGLTAPAPALASTSDWNIVTSFLSMSSYGVVLFNQLGARSSPPSCGAAPGLNLRWAINTSTPGGQSTLSVLLYAYAMHKRIYIQGTGDCSVWSDTETVSYFLVED